MKIAVRTASMADIESLSVIGSAAYAAEYGQFWIDARGMARWLEGFRQSVFSQALEDPNARLWALECDDQIVGFSMVRMNSPNAIDGRPDGAELQKLYILPGAQGLGLGKQAVEVAVAEVTRAGMTHLWLGVMDSANALTVYRSWGFQDLGKRRLSLPLKPGLEGMVILFKDIG